MAPEVLLIRHAQSEWNAVGRWQGHGDPPLSEHGRAQARALAEALRLEPCVRLLCSDLRRARETAAPLAEAWGIRAELDHRLRELDVGDWTGLTREQIADAAPDRLRAFESGAPDVRPGDGESRAELRARARRVVQELAREPGPIAVVTHLGFVRALVPGAEPGHTDCLRARADALLELRPRAEDDARPGAL